MQIVTTAKDDASSLLGLLCAIYLAVFIALGFYSQPTVDDFDFAYKLFNKGFIGSQISWYTEWTGRYASTALITVFIKFSDLINNYWQIPVLLILCTVTAFSLVVYCFGKQKLLVWQALCWGLFLTCLYLAGVPSPAETIYWLSGGVTYQGGNILFLLLLATAASMSSGVSSSMVRRLKFIFSCMLVVAIAGMNETVMLCEMIFLMLATLICFRYRLNERFIYLSLFLVGFASSLVVLLAPGNEQRLKAFPNAHDMWFSLFSAMKKGVMDTVNWSLSLSLVIATVIVVPAVISHIKSIRPGFTFGKKSLVFIAIGWLLMVSLYFPSFWSMGTAPPQRTHSVIYLLFIFWWIYSAVVVCSFTSRRCNKISHKYSVMVTIVFGITLIVTGNGSTALNDLRKGESYFSDLQRRYEIIRESRSQGKQHIQVPALEEYPWTIHVNDITGNASDWRNVPCAKYFGIGSISSTGRYHQTTPGH